MTRRPRSFGLVGKTISTASTITVALVVLVSAVPFIEEAVHAQEPSGTINEITPSVGNITLRPGDTVWLSINVIDLQDAHDQNLARNANISWSATDGELNVGDDRISATYIAPVEPGTYTVTATAGPACVGDADNCTATFAVRVRRGTESGPHFFLPDPPKIPRKISDDNGAQYEVFTPAEGGTFTGEDFSATAEPGTIPNGEYIGVRMAEDGSASDAGMPHHRYSLSGSQYKISVVDAGGAPLRSYTLRTTINVCIPVADELRSSISNATMVMKNSDGTLTAMSSSVRITSSLILCGNTDTLPATVAAGVPGTPPPSPEPEPPEKLPDTGGAAPSSTSAVVWALLLGIALIGAGVFVTAYRRRRYEGNR